jgi:fructose-bisphosphate aldolase class I
MQQQQVAMEGVILKASMVISALDCPNRAGVRQVAEETVRCLRSTVPEDLPGVVFLSGGQSNPEATDHLNAMNKHDIKLPWPLTFSYARALQNPAMEIWSGKAENVAAARKAFYHRARVNSAAAQGKYTPEMEKEAA